MDITLQFKDDNDDEETGKKGKFTNSKKGDVLSKYKKDKNAPQATKTDDSEKKPAKVFKAEKKVTLGAKWDNDELENEKKLAIEKLKELDEKVQDKEEIPKKKEQKFVGKAALSNKTKEYEEAEKERQRLAQEKLKQIEIQDKEEITKKKEPKFVGKAALSNKTKEYEEEEKERQRLAQEKLKQIDQSLSKSEVKVDLVKDKPNEKRFTNSKKNINNKTKDSNISNKVDEVPKVKKPLVSVNNIQNDSVPLAKTTAARW